MAYLVHNRAVEQPDANRHPIVEHRHCVPVCVQGVDELTYHLAV